MTLSTRAEHCDGHAVKETPPRLGAARQTLGVMLLRGSCKRDPHGEEPTPPHRNGPLRILTAPRRAGVLPKCKGMLKAPAVGNGSAVDLKYSRCDAALHKQALARC